MSFALLHQASLVEVLFYLEKIKEAKISVIKDALDITQHSLYASIEKLDREGLVIDNKQATQRLITITPKGELIARKLSYVFDETKEVIAINKNLYEELAKILRDRKTTITVEAWVHEQIRDFIE